MIAVAVRADAGLTIGTGHVMRCLTLARELKGRGADITFVCRRQPGDLIGLLEHSGFEVRPLAEPPRAATGDYAAWLGAAETDDAAETMTALRGRHCDWVVADHYGIGAGWQRCMRQQATGIAVIDDLANRHHDCDVLLDQNYFGAVTDTRYDDRVPATAIRLLGPRFALLPDAYRHADRTGVSRDGVIRHVLLFFGGADQTNETAKALAALSEGPAALLHVDVVVGSSHPDPEGIRAQAARRPRTTVFSTLPTLSSLMARADLFVGSAGSTTWERAYFGVPSVVVFLAENQAGPARALADQHRQIALDGRGPNGLGVDDWSKAIAAILADPERAAALGAALAPLVDGRGAQRVARALLREHGLRVSVRPATADDEQAWFDWANDPGVRALSFSSRDIDRAGHARWFQARLANPACIMLVAEDEVALPLGQVRLDINAGAHEAVVSISVDRCARGIGIGDELLRSAIERLHARAPGMPVIAEVLDHNDRSARLFLRRGFQETARRHDGARCFILQATEQ